MSSSFRRLGFSNSALVGQHWIIVPASGGEFIRTDVTAEMPSDEEASAAADERILEDLELLEGAVTAAAAAGNEKNVAGPDLTRLASIVLSFLVSPTSYDVQANLNAYADATPSVGAAALKAGTRGLMVLYHEFMKEGLTVAQARARCAAVGDRGLGPHVTDAVVDAWGQKTSRVAASLIARTVAANKLVDMDWSFGVTVASSDNDQVGKMYLQLRLTVDEQSRGHCVYFVEMTVEQFYTFLAALEVRRFACLLP